MRRPEDFQGPTNGELATDYGTRISIVQHPAFRIGFLDAQANRPFDHDHIVERISSETPKGALRRLGWDQRLFRITPRDVELAQYRYEEGRILSKQEGLRCKAWGHPDFPPVQVREFVRRTSRLSEPRDDVDVLALWKAAAKKAPAVSSEGQ